VVLSALFAALLGGGAGALFALGHRGPANATGAASALEATERTVPAAVAAIPLLNQDGRTEPLSSLRGHVVVMADFMTSCGEECPITLGALMSLERALKAAHLLDKVEIVEVSIDGWRDTPARLRAYQRYTGAHWTMLTGSVAELSRFWSFFGVAYWRVPESKPPAINWETGKPYRFDIDHSDDVFVLGPGGNERYVAPGYADVGGHLPARLVHLLDPLGRQDLAHPGYGAWTPGELLAAIGTLLGHKISLVASTTRP
jgi:cytochrome oxidase Cu insertion factor (SCO1/SenC/PrrC family)